MTSFTTKDLELWQLWQAGEDSPLSTIPRQWAHFPAGTPRVEVWQWFDQQFSLGLVGMIETMQPTLKTTYHLSLKAFVTEQVETAQQLGMFGASDDDDWGAKIQKKTEKQNRLF